MREKGTVAFSTEFESEAFDNNIVRLELLQDGTSVYTSFNSKHEQTACSYFGERGCAHA